MHSLTGILARTMNVLQCFSEDEPELSAVQLAERTGLAASTLHRLLVQLIGAGLIVRLPEHRYAIGPKLWELGELSPLALRLSQAAQPHMLRLHEATGGIVHLAVIDGPPESATALFVGRITGSGSIPTLTRMGGRNPLHTTGVGKALLLTRNLGWLADYFTTPLVRETTHSITTEAELRADLEAARRRGYSVTREEMTLGNLSVGVPLGAVAGLPPTAIGVVVRLEHADEHVLAPLVMQAAMELTKAVRAS